MKNIKTTENSSVRKIQSKFGEIEIDESNAVFFPHGILGFPLEMRFCFVNSTIEKFKNFVYMQSTTSDDLTFLIRPINISDQTLIAEADVDAACEQLSIDRASLAVVLVASVKALETGQKVLVANVKAPIFINSATHEARQYVFQNSNYDTQHIL